MFQQSQQSDTEHTETAFSTHPPSLFLVASSDYFATAASLCLHLLEAMHFSLFGGPGVGKGTFSKLLVERLRLRHVSVGDILRKQAQSSKFACGSDGEESSRLDARSQEELQKMSSGALVSDALVQDIVRREVHKYQASSSSLQSQSSSSSSSQSPPTCSGLLLDGFPRNISQARFLLELLPAVRVIHIRLDKEIAVEKLLGRRVCSGCHRSFNLADVRTIGYDMPAILPGDPSTCPIGRSECLKRRNLQLRSDDTKETIMRRFEVFEKESFPVLDFFASKDKLKSFDVQRGVDDIDDLIDLMLSE